VRRKPRNFISPVPPDEPPEAVADAVAFSAEVDLAWYVLHIAPPPAETIIDRSLRRLGLEYHIFTELRRRPREAPVRTATFPGYMFVRFDVNGLRWQHLHRTPGVLAILGETWEEEDGDGEILTLSRPLAIPNDVMDEVFRAHREREFESGLDWSPKWSQGERLKVIGGPFAGLAATFQGYRSKRIHALVEIFGRASLVKLERKDLEG
jgi:transcription antitermination factor NusG